jgi:guanine nucleotide-binding protein subunit beta-2-like 1 protein
MLWDLNEGKHLYSLEAGDIINALVFSPNRCALHRLWFSVAAHAIQLLALRGDGVVHQDLRP